MSAKVKSFFVYMFYFLLGFIASGAICWGCFFGWIALTFRMPGDGPSYSFAGWSNGLSKIPSYMIEAGASPLPYYLININNAPERDHYYHGMEVKVALKEIKDLYPPSSLAATCAAAAKYYAKKHEPEAVRVSVYEDPEQVKKNEDWMIVADCLYSPEGTGWDPREEHPWTWQDMKVRGLSFGKKELEVKKALADMRRQNGYVKAGRHDIFWAREDVGRLTGMSRDEVFEIEKNNNKVLFPASVFKYITPEAPVN